MLYNRFPEGKTKCFTLSYDDANYADRRMIEIADRYGVRVTFHLNSALLGVPNRVPKEEVPELYKNHEVSMHTATHPRLTSLPLPLALRQITEDRAALEAITGKIIRGMSYPYGPYNEDILHMLKSAGVCYSRTIKSTHKYLWPEDFRAWDPTCHHSENALEHVKEFMETPSHGDLLYIWGHSYEFNENDNWDLLEEICRMVTTDAGDKPEQKADTVWLATNIEIYDYITAIRRLIVSMDGKTVYNPSALDVWVEEKKEPIKIPAGATVHL